MNNKLSKERRTEIMKEQERIAIQNLTAPGSLTQSLFHPEYPDRRCVDISLFNSHRYAFFFWNKWTKQYVYEMDYINTPPCLISLDWHQDLRPPKIEQKRLLKKLDTNNNKDVAMFAWAKLNYLNDDHIKAAAYLNLIGNIFRNKAYRASYILSYLGLKGSLCWASLR